MTRRTRLRGAAALVLAAMLTVTACGGGDEPTKKPTPPKGPVLLTFAVYGPAPVVTTYAKIAADYTSKHPNTVVNIHPYDSHDDALKAILSQGRQGNPPDLFLMQREDLPALLEQKATRRVDELLGEREVDFGDGYQRDGLQQFSAKDALQCMPSEVSPLVVYYNTRLVNLNAVTEQGDAPINPAKGWTIDQFARAAELASSSTTRGVYVAPELDQIAPFVWSAGGTVVDDDTRPTTLKLSDSASAEGLQKLLEVVRNPAWTFNPKQLKQRDALSRFKAGELGMILGTRDLTPQLRNQQGLGFDVLPLPKVAKQATTVQMSGLCISKESAHTKQTADFLAYLVGDEPQELLAKTGYLVPSNVDVLHAEAFIQTGEQPASSEVFVNGVKGALPLPTVPAWHEVNVSIAAALNQLFYLPVIDPLEDRLKAIDATSVPIFTPPTSTPSPTTSSNPAPSPAS